MSDTRDQLIEAMAHALIQAAHELDDAAERNRIVFPNHAALYREAADMKRKVAFLACPQYVVTDDALERIAAMDWEQGR